SWPHTVRREIRRLGGGGSRIQCPQGLTCGQISPHPVDDQAAHFRGFLVGAVEELDAAILLVAVLPIKRQQVIAYLLDAGGRREGILAAVDAEMRPRDD